MNKTKTYYQPCAYYDDGTNIEYGNTPEELMSFQAFASREDCEEWLENNGYDAGSFAIIEYHDEDIEGVTILDEFGDIVEINEDGENDEAIREILSSYHEAELENMSASSRADALAFYAEKFAEYIENILD